MRLPHLLRRSRPGFTLIELLVVIAIIGLLASLIVGATFRVIGVQQTRNTDLLIQKLYPELRKQWQATIDQSRNEKIPDAVYTAAGNDGRRAQVIWTKLRLKQQFPTSIAEAINPAPGLITPEPAYGSLAGLTAAGPMWEQSACLYLALKNNRRGSGFDVDTLTPRETMPTNLTGVRFIIDDWKTPLGFVRWPAPSDPAFQNVPQRCPPNFLDSQDPEGTLSNPAWDATAFKAAAHQVFANQSYVVDPYIWSTGGPSNRTLYSFRQRIGGTGG